MVEYKIGNLLQRYEMAAVHAGRDSYSIGLNKALHLVGLCSVFLAHADCFSHPPILLLASRISRFLTFSPHW